MRGSASKQSSREVDEVPPRPLLERESSQKEVSSPNTRGKSMLGFFGRSRKDENSNNNQLGNVPTGNFSPTKSVTSTRERESKVVETLPPVVNLPTKQHSQKRDKSTNSQATLLRGQIAATEYELHRLTKTMRKKVRTLTHRYL